MEAMMKRISLLFLLTILSLGAFTGVSHAQLDKIVIAAGTPEDQALTAITSEPDPQKKLAMYQDYVQKFSSNPAAVAYGNWQISQTYQTAGDLQKALDYGDKALAGSPRDLDILVSQAGISQSMKNNAKTIEYATRGGAVYNSLATQPRPEGMSDQDFARRVAEDQDSAKSSCEFLEAAAFNAVAAESDAKTRMDYIERFTTAFPGSRFHEQITSYALVSLSELKDTPRLIAFAERTLAADPNNLPTLLLLAGTYADDSKPGSAAKAASYAQKAIDVAKADAPDADHARKLSAGAAYATLGYADMKQDKTATAIPELKSACALLKGQDEQQYAIAAYRLGFAYAKLSRLTEAREVLSEIVNISGPVQQPARDLLAKVNAARAKGK
jgi:tetratricopeptide (TPR) repeat protein